MKVTLSNMYEYYDNLELDSKSRYEKKIKLAQLEECPYKLPASVWKDDTSSWPNIHYGDIYDYLINTPGKKIVDSYILISY